jgi:hypothetical protein
MEEAPAEKSSSTPTEPGVNPATSPLKQIRTFQGDVATALERQRESLYSIQETERLKRASGGTVVDPSASIPGKRKQFFFLLLGSFFLIGLGLVGARLGYSEYLRKTAPPVIAVPQNRFVTPQESIDIDATGLSRENIFSITANEASGLGADSIKHLVLRRGALEDSPLVTSEGFFIQLVSSAPGSLVRAFDPLFMLGTLGDSRFIIFKLSSFENAFAGMLSWEEKMAEDLGPIFKTGPLVKNIIPPYVFKDIVSKNKDARVLFAPLSPESTTTTPVLLYSFFDNKMLIITDSLNTLETLIERLTQESLSR